MNAEIFARLSVLRMLRLSAADTAAELKRRRDAFDVENAALIQNVRDDAASVAAQETAIKAIVADDYAVTVNKTPCPGVTVKEFETLQYDEAAAFAWAKEKGLAIIPESLDRKAFEKIAKAAGGAIAGAHVIVEPRVQIATDLEKALGLDTAGTVTTVAPGQAGIS
jgi:hypothetical protein